MKTTPFGVVFFVFLLARTHLHGTARWTVPVTSVFTGHYRYLLLSQREEQMQSKSDETVCIRCVCRIVSCFLVIPVIYCPKEVIL